ncbi:unnamed protein product [Meganyctiphanes norvegica]|uniref:Tudor domain-containing protein n=1 Tax=Meganyctiphanes norvegica TaxID=48144 RepID=A0AAV2S3F8_MEGNR
MDRGPTMASTILKCVCTKLCDCQDCIKEPLPTDGSINVRTLNWCPDAQQAQVYLKEKTKILEKKAFYALSSDMKMISLYNQGQKRRLEPPFYDLPYSFALRILIFSGGNLSFHHTNLEDRNPRKFILGRGFANLANLVLLNNFIMKIIAIFSIERIQTSYIKLSEKPAIRTKPHLQNKQPYFNGYRRQTPTPKYRPISDYPISDASRNLKIVDSVFYVQKKFQIRNFRLRGFLNFCLILSFGGLEFYSSPIGERYKITNENLQIRAPVAVLFKEDENWYRAIVTSLVDLTSVKLFFIDYGTEGTCFNKFLRKMHTNFFHLPAQAVEGSLHGIRPVNDTRRWSRRASKKLLNLLQDKPLVANIIKVENATVYMSLWDTTDCDIHISDLLVSEGLAEYEECNISSANPKKNKSVYSNECIEKSINAVSGNSEISQQTNEELDVLTKFENSPNMCAAKNHESFSISKSKNNFSTGDLKYSYTSKTENIGTIKVDENSSLPSNSNITEKPEHKNLDSNIINSSADMKKVGFIQEENMKLKVLLDECNRLLRRDDQSSENKLQPPPGFGTSKYQEFHPNDMHCNSKYQEVQPNYFNLDIGTVVDETCKMTQLVPILSSTPRDVDSTPNPALSISSILPEISQLPETHEKAPSVPPGFDMKPKLTSRSAMPSAYEPLQNNFTDLIKIQPDFCNAAPKDVQTEQQNSETNSLHDETFFSDDDLCGSSLSLNITHRTVESFSLTSKYTVHVLKLNEAPYILSGDISQVLWESDKLRTALAKKRIDLPFVILNQTTHPDIFQQLIKLKAAAAMDSFGEPLMSLFAYPLQVVPPEYSRHLRKIMVLL